VHTYIFEIYEKNEKHNFKKVSQKPYLAYVFKNRRMQILKYNYLWEFSNYNNILWIKKNRVH